MAEKSRRRRSKQMLLSEEMEKDGVSNPTLDEEVASHYRAFSRSQTEGESSAAETVEEQEQSVVLEGELKSRHRRRRRELSKLVSPKDDVSGQLKTVKLDSRKKVEETQLEDDLALALAEAGAAAAGETLSTGDLETVPQVFQIEQDEGTSASVQKEEVTEVAESRPVLETQRSTIRERMKHRLAKAKEEAATELEQQERDERNRARRGRKEPKFEELDEDEMRTLQERTARFQKMKLERAKQQEALSFMPTSEEAFDFFTRVWEPEPEEVAEAEKREAEEAKRLEEEEAKRPEKEEAKDEEKAEGEEPETEEERAAKEEEGKEEESKLLEDEDYTEEGYGPVAIRKAYTLDPDEISRAEQEMLYYPSTAVVPAGKKVEGDAEPRFLEDEGFYVGVKPYVADRNKNKMENRLLKEAEVTQKPSKWFGEDGQMIALPSPLAETPTRPVLQEDELLFLDTVFYKAILREFDSRYIDGAIDGGGFYQLDVDINSVSFTHHHLFSREHVLAKKLTLLYEEYLSRAKRNMAEFLTEKLAALKNSAVLLHTYISKHKGEMAVHDRDNYERRLRDYKSEIRQTRFLRDREECTDRTLLKSIIHTWKEIKLLREQQKYTNTSVRLQIRKETTDKSAELERWNFEIEEEIREEQERHEEEFMRKEAVYKNQLEKYGQQILAKEEAQKRMKERRRHRKASMSSKNSKVSKKSQDTAKSKLVKEDEDENFEEENARDQEIIDEEPLPKPEPPEPFDQTALRELIMAKAKTQKRQPGEPKLFPEMSNTATITPYSQCSRREQQRRDDVTKCKLYVKILFNGKEVSRTGPRPLLQDFNVSFGQIYNLKIVEWPESVKYEIYETSGFGSGRRLAELYAPIPESSVTSQSVMLENIEFSTYEKIAFDHEGVGSGVSFTFEGIKPDPVILMTSGVLNSSVAWAVGEDGLPLVPMEKFGANFQAAMQIKKLDPFVAIGASGVANMEKLLHWFRESRLDPNDPDNKDIVYMLSGSDQSLLQPREYFRLEPLQQEFDFASSEDIEKNLRFKMIELRDEEHPLFKGYQMVPAYEKELSKDIFKEYEKRKRGETQLQQVKNDLDIHRAQVDLYLQQIKDRVMAQYRFASHQKSLQDMVNEDIVPNVGVFVTAILRLSEPRRPLKPVRKERKKVTATGLIGRDVKILINIIRATFIPVRKPSQSPTTGGQTARDYDGKPRDVYSELVCPFVEVMFQRSWVRTRRGEGPNPSFNEELELPLKAPGDDYSPSSLQNIEDIIYINLFDEVTVDILEDDRQRESNVHQRIEKKWLGSIKIPFSSVYFNNIIDGTFRLSTPPFLLGYTYDSQVASGGLAAEVESSIGQGSTFLSMFVTIEPSLALPEPFKERLATNEEEELISRADLWQANLEKRFPKRIFRTTVMDTNGRNVFVTRFFRGIKPPPEVLACQDSQKAMELAAHYVSLIPFVSDTALFPGQCDIWSTCNQFMKMLCGDEEEHAVLLTNFFLAMDKRAWLLLGTAIPEGRTAYVLTEENGKFTLWNARSGERFSVYDNYCPLQIVGCVINAENIWANIQQYEKPSQMSFSFNATSNWQPFYNRSFPSRGLASVQPADLHYHHRDRKSDSLVLELQERIEQLLKNKIMEWRSRNITRWNRHCTQIMRKLLPILEDNCGKPIDQSYLKDLEDSFRSYKVSGFPLNLPYVDMNNITETVFSTGVHAQETNDVEFALAVYVRGYSNNVMSIWIYVASLIRLR